MTVPTTGRINLCKIINFPKVSDYRGNLTFIEGNIHVPFEIKRVYYIYDIPSGETRGGHAHIELEQVIIALSGSFEVVVDDGYTRKSFFLNRPHYGLYVPPGIWRELINFSSNSVALVLASTLYDEKDYIRDYETFKKMVSGGFWDEKKKL
ncbi:WxcM-like domain-containing protein [Methanocaldococcus bathoardescens]|uniref:WxcM-like domain-containing protein n=1 Tax=Methanocaldococcus bathoardescens TaxID=1301915 RepID=A0A076LDQ3_9EURY|nr:FdtA/QdtA family cupin domain-containing protein [Methanocaldococcus bathoardescens]AIJ04932.1 WxcM-like domain-containing protein [Methanocaldococcus bathoardescens]